MTSLIDTFNSLGLATTSATKAAKTAGKEQSLSQSEFLKLLTTQLTHQDPTKPMDNAQFVSQMAQISTVTGLQDLQNSFKDLNSSMSGDQGLQAAGLVGHYVSAPGSEALLSAGGFVSGDIDVPSSVSGVTVNIVDPHTGEVVRTLDLGAQSEGSVGFEWDGYDAKGGLAKPGLYQISATSRINGTNTALNTNVNSLVKSVTLGSGSSGLKVNLDGLGEVKFSQIKQIL